MTFFSLTPQQRLNNSSNFKFDRFPSLLIPWPDYIYIYIFPISLTPHGRTPHDDDDDLSSARIDARLLIIRSSRVASEQARALGWQISCPTTLGSLLSFSFGPQSCRHSPHSTLEPLTILSPPHSRHFALSLCPIPVALSITNRLFT